MTFAVVDYSNLVKQAQEDVWRLIDESTAVQAFTTNILNNQPASKVGERIGVPYIVIPTPRIDERRLTLTQKQIFIIFEIEIVFTRIDNLGLIDAVRTLLSSNSSTFSGTYRLHQFLINDAGVDYITLPDGHKAQSYKLPVEFEWIGDPA